jgi:NADH-ubiquinone oxidoreductase chain 1
MTEHSAVIFVFFFLAEYASIVLICIFTSILFLGGYLKMFSLDFLVNGLFFFDIINIDFIKNIYTETNISFINTLLDGLISSLMLGIKSCLMIFVFIWARASLPRIRFDQLMSYCWTVLLPIIIAFIILVPCVVYSLSLIPTNFYLI